MGSREVTAKLPNPVTSGPIFFGHILDKESEKYVHESVLKWTKLIEYDFFSTYLYYLQKFGFPHIPFKSENNNNYVNVIQLPPIENTYLTNISGDTVIETLTEFKGELTLHWRTAWSTPHTKIKIYVKGKIIKDNLQLVLTKWTQLV
ncbi:MAG TPA: hypothetical protein VKA95_00915 [Nitrososphaeraceae archaeon]|nr:hypothetical protein [Nitrososphaeraceae archaeon]